MVTGSNDDVVTRDWYNPCDWCGPTRPAKPPVGGLTEQEQGVYLLGYVTGYEEAVWGWRIATKATERALVHDAADILILQEDRHP